MRHTSAEQICNCRQPDMRVRKYVERFVTNDLYWTHIVNEHERADAAAFAKGKHPADVERADACDTVGDHDLYHKKVLDLTSRNIMTKHTYAVFVNHKEHL